MKLEYEQVEELYDDTTHLRTITEQAVVPGQGVLLRTTVYSPHNVAVSVNFVHGLEQGFEAIGS